MTFPEYPIEISEAAQETGQAAGKSLLFDFEAGEFATQDGRLIPLEGRQSLRVWIEKCIRTEAGKAPIYQQDTGSYGVRIADLVGRRWPEAFLQAELERELTSALLCNPEILDVREFLFTREGRALSVSFTVESAYGDEEMEMQWLTK